MKNKKKRRNSVKGCGVQTFRGWYASKQAKNVENWESKSPLPRTHKSIWKEVKKFSLWIPFYCSMMKIYCCFIKKLQLRDDSKRSEMYRIQWVLKMFPGDIQKFFRGLNLMELSRIARVCITWGFLHVSSEIRSNRKFFVWLSQILNSHFVSLLSDKSEIIRKTFIWNFSVSEQERN